MAFRRLTVAERFALKGATSWRAMLVDPAAVGDPVKGKWGFVPQKRLVRAMTEQRDRYRFRTHVDRDNNFIEGISVAEDFQKYSIDFAEFKDGAKFIYSDVTSLFCDPHTDFRDVELVSPRLSLFLNDCLVGYELAGYPSPSIEIEGVNDVDGGGSPAVGSEGSEVHGAPAQGVDTLVQDLSVEFGNIDHYGKLFGIYDWQEVRFHLLGGFSPEITTANEYMGDGPKRIVASVLYTVKEKVWFADREDKPADVATNVHYFEFESSLRGPIHWRLRNINKVIDTP
eukprot:m.164784 g.164784  ORF g.164784 m.164784 type:complete len:284 (+) comp12471_c0_seq1:1219-2070(+)